jgi:hypothetical protein
MANTGMRGSGIRVLRDLVVIIAGVLVALSADAWWKGLEESAEELDYLLALERDLSAAAPELRIAIGADSAIAARNRRAIETLHSQEDTESFGMDLSFKDIVIPTGTLRALIGAGDIELIRSTALRTEILALDALIERTLSWRQTLEAQVIVNVGAIFRDQEAARLRSPAPPGVPPNLGAMLSELRASPGFIAAVSFHNVILQNRISLHRELLIAVEELQGALEEELEGRTG